MASIDNNPYPNLTAVLEEYGTAFRNLYQDRLILADKIASGELLNSVNFRLNVEGTIYQVIINFGNAYYWKYVEEGIAPAGKYGNPGWKTFPHIKDWITIKPVLPRPNDKGKLPTLNQLSYLITRKIVNEGIKPTPLLAETAAALNMQYKQKIVEAFRKDVYLTLRNDAFSTL